MESKRPSVRASSPRAVLEIAFDAVERIGENWRRTLGLLAVVVGSLFIVPAVSFFARMAFAQSKTEAAIEQRYYEMTPRFAPAEAAQALAQGPLTWRFNVRSMAVLAYEAPDASAHRVLFRNPRTETETFGSLDYRIPLPWLELRFPAGELELMRTLPRDPIVDLSHPCPWCKTRYDELIDKVDDPEALLVHAWTSARGATVPLLLDPGHPDLPFLDDDRAFERSLQALPAVFMGGMFLCSGLLLALRRGRTTDDDQPLPPPRPRTPADWIWIIFVLSAPLWVRVFPSAIGWYSADAAAMVADLVEKPVSAVQFFDVAVAEPAPAAAPHDSVRALGQDSPYLPLWSELKFERPSNCCQTGDEVISAASAQATAQIRAFDPEHRARFAAAADQLRQQGHIHLGALIDPGLNSLSKSEN